MLISEIFAAVNSENPHHPVIQMLDEVEIFENYLEPGMVGRVVGAKHDGDDVIIIDLVLTEFEEFNKQFESANYYDQNGNPCLTARESGNYEQKLSLFLDLELEAEKVFKLMDRSDIATLTDPVKTFESTLSIAQAKNVHELSSFSLDTASDLAVHLFKKGDVTSPLAIATRSLLSYQESCGERG